jgi:chromosome segregation ATPase
MSDVSKFSKDINHLQAKYNRLKNKPERTPEEKEMMNDIHTELEQLKGKRERLKVFMKKESIESRLGMYLVEDRKDSIKKQIENLKDRIFKDNATIGELAGGKNDPDVKNLRKDIENNRDKIKKLQDQLKTIK